MKGQPKHHWNSAIYADKSPFKQNINDEIETDHLIEQFSEALRRAKSSRKIIRPKSAVKPSSRPLVSQDVCNTQDIKKQLVKERKKFIMASTSFNYMSKFNNYLPNQRPSKQIARNKAKGVVPLNSFHPASCLFTAQNKDDHLNKYEHNYLQLRKKSTKPDRQPEKSEFVSFYSGGSNIEPKPLTAEKQQIRKCLMAFVNKAKILNCFQIPKQTQKVLKSSHLSPSPFNQRSPDKKDSINSVEVTSSSPTVSRHQKAKQLKENLLLKSIEQTIQSNLNNYSHSRYYKNRKTFLQCLGNKKKLIASKLLATARQNSWNPLTTQNYIFDQNDVNLADKQGNSALYYAVKYKNTKFIQYLLRCGANVNQRCAKGETPLHLAFAGNSMPIIVECISHSPDLNTACDEGYTPIGRGAYKTLKVLGLLDGVATVGTLKKNFDNNRLLERTGSIFDEFHPIAL